MSVVVDDAAFRCPATPPRRLTVLRLQQCLWRFHREALRNSVRCTLTPPRNLGTDRFDQDKQDEQVRSAVTRTMATMTQRRTMNQGIRASGRQGHKRIPNRRSGLPADPEAHHSAVGEFLFHRRNPSRLPPTPSPPLSPSSQHPVYTTRFSRIRRYGGGCCAIEFA
ncbi:hypothetical protein M433DRAFT_532582 [Acidomyces richmondensis BFW]|nr:MAG: hypothetical protein FE78DRAFT_337956 [Acidomyces sp. 'richmondensis']KYG46866.1 hypothetical protein M433DRAFT_532582 [Acidomyces richmondensis BFW]